MGLEGLNNIDTDWFLYLNSIRGTFGDTFFYLFSGKSIWIPMYAAIVYALFVNFKWKQAFIYLVAIAAVIVLADYIGASIIRPIFQRPRPCNELSPIHDIVYLVNGYRPGGVYGFPSCHAANTMALATIVSLSFRRFWLSIFMFSWSLATCYSRIYLAAHYPGDLIAGSILGILLAIPVYYGAIFLSKRWCGNGFRNKGERKYISIGKNINIKYYPSSAIILVGCVTILYICIVSI